MFLIWVTNFLLFPHKVRDIVWRLNYVDVNLPLVLPQSYGWCVISFDSSTMIRPFLIFCGFLQNVVCCCTPCPSNLQGGSRISISKFSAVQIMIFQFLFVLVPFVEKCFTKVDFWVIAKGSWIFVTVEHFWRSAVSTYTTEQQSVMSYCSSSVYPIDISALWGGDVCTAVQI